MRLCLVPIVSVLAAGNLVQARNTDKTDPEPPENIDRRPETPAPSQIVPGTSTPPATTRMPPNNMRTMSPPASGSMIMPPLQPPPGLSPNSGPLPGQVNTGLLTVTGIGALNKRLPETIATGALVASGMGAISVALPATVTTGPLMATGAAQ